MGLLSIKETEWLVQKCVKCIEKAQEDVFSLECEAAREIIGIAEPRLWGNDSLTREPNCQFQKEDDSAN